MTERQVETRNDKAQNIRVFEITEGEYYVESSQGQVCYKVNINGTRTCACGDFAIHAKEPDFACKHILAATNGNGNVIRLYDPHKVKLEERFIKQIKGKDFVLYPGVLDLGHQEGIKRLEVEAVQYPTKENGQNAVCKVILETTDGKVYVDYGDANPQNVNKEVAGHVLRVASTRGKARVLRDCTNVGMTCLEELGDLDDVAPDLQKDHTSVGKPSRKVEPRKDIPREATTAPGSEKKKTESAVPAETASSPEQAKKEPEPDKRKAAETSLKDRMSEAKNPDSAEGDKPTISVAQKNAIDNLAKRRGLSPETVKELATKQYGKDLDAITTAEASTFIRYLQQAA